MVFPYDGLNKDELSLRVGQVVTILTREVEDDGWWKGELDGAVGVFPENFVKLIVKDNSDKKPQRPPPPTNLPSTSSENIVRDDKENGKKLSKSLSFEEKYGLASLKNELSETSVSMNMAQNYKQTTNRQAPRPHSYIPTINVTNVKEKGKTN